MTNTKTAAAKGCTSCQTRLGAIVGRNLCPPHPGHVCKECGAFEASVYRSIAAARKRASKVGA